MAAKYNPQVGHIVHVVFWDHCENFHDAMQFEAIGRITSMTRKAYIIHTWQYHNPIQRAADKNADDNENSFAIVKRAVDSITRLK